MDQSTPTVFIVGANDAKLSESLETLHVPSRRFETLEGFFSSVNSASRGCVIANLHLHGVGGFDLLLELSNRRSTLPVIIISKRISTRMVVKAMREGAATVLEMPVNTEELFFAVRDALKKNEEKTRQKKQLELLQSRFGHLSAGEQQVLDHLCGGLSNKEIATVLRVHIRTVEARKKRLLDKTESESVAQLLITFQRFRNTSRSISDFDYQTSYGSRSKLLTAQSTSSDSKSLVEQR